MDPKNEPPESDVLDAVENLCNDYMAWLDRMKRTEGFDPKNHPTQNQLRERDAILARIRAVATPDVILKLVKVAQAKRGEV